MAEPTGDRIHIRRLHARCIIGIVPEERTEKQDVYLDITMHADLRTAGASDAIEDTIDYKSVKKRILAMVEASEALIDPLLDLLVLSARRFPVARFVIVTERRFAPYEGLLRELGAAHVEPSPRDLRRVLDVIDRHFANLVQFESPTSLVPTDLPELPWGLKLKPEDFAPPAD